MSNKEKQKLRILADMDGVLVNLLPAWLRVYGERTGEWIHQDQITEYDYEQFVSQPKVFFECLEEALRDAEPTEGSSVFRSLYQNPAFDLYIVTYAHLAAQSVHGTKIKWLQKYFPDFDLNRIIFAKNKALVAGDILIEDCEANIAAWEQYHPYGTALLIKQPYNKTGMSIRDAALYCEIAAGHFDYEVL